LLRHRLLLQKLLVHVGVQLHVAYMRIVGISGHGRQWRLRASFRFEIALHFEPPAGITR
jgi:hypothetical protein